jgi:hypothetical protein
MCRVACYLKKVALLGENEPQPIDYKKSLENQKKLLELEQNSSQIHQRFSLLENALDQSNSKL